MFDNAVRLCYNLTVKNGRETAGNEDTVKMTFAQRAKELVAQMTLAEKCAQLRHDAPAIERLGIPAYNWWNEGLHGVARSGVATVFPQSIAMAASFDDDLMEQVGTAVSDEARAKYNEYKKFGDTGYYMGLTYWSPNINIFRDPRWGRGHETYGEDPCLTGHMGAAFVRGLQGDPQYTYRKLDATLKHYAVHSGPEASRHGFDAKVSKKDLWETYLWAFRYCINHAHPACVMGAYNAVNGEPCCASPEMQGNILYGKLGFDGYFVSDCGAIADITDSHHLNDNYAQSAADALKNGCTLNCGSAYAALLSAVAAGLISEEVITAAVEKLFTSRFALGMFDTDCKYDDIPYDVVDCEAHRALNRRMAQESVVLLKNNGILPLKNDSDLTVAIIGNNADRREVLLGNYNGTPFASYTPFEAMKNRFRGKLYYGVGCHTVEDEDPSTYIEHPLREAVIAAQKADVVIMCMGIDPSIEGEQGDAYSQFGDSGDKRSLELPHAQKVLYEAVKATGKPIVFVNISGSAIALGDQDENCDAVIQLFYPGAEGGNALFDVLFGEVNPSGRLPLTFYRSDADLPDFSDYSMENRTYRYFTGKPLYPFGYGLSYTTFSYGTPRVCKADGDYTVSVTVKNTGDRDGDTVVQLYYTVEDAPCRVPLRSLVAFRRVSLAAGEETETVFTLREDELCYVDEDGRFCPAQRITFTCGES